MKGRCTFRMLHSIMLTHMQELCSALVPRFVQEHAHIVNMSLLLPLFMCVFYVLYAECNNHELA